MSTRKTAEEIAKNIISVCNTLKNNNNDVTVSGLIYRKNVNENIKIDDICNKLQVLCHERNHRFVDNSDIPPRLLRDRIHLNKAGNDFFF